MPYNDFDLIRSHRKRRASNNGVLFLCIAFFVFLVIGLSVSLTMRACYHNKGDEKSNPCSLRVDSPQEYVIGSDKTLSNDFSEMSDSVSILCMPLRLEGVSEQIICKTAYIVSYNRDTKIPNWVAWHLTADHADGSIRRMSNFYEEESVAYPRATLEDYRGSGWSRGHMCPAGDNKWNETAMYESFSLVNICPQNANLNSGLWNRIEMDCRRWARRYGDIYIVCGPVLLNRKHETIGRNKVVVPEAFFKVILRLKPEPKAIGFVIRNNEGRKRRDQFINTVDDVERITGIDFFPALPDDIENRVEAKTNIEDWR